MGGSDALVGCLGRIPIPIRTKLLAAFLLIEILLVALGATGLLALRKVERRTDDLASLQHTVLALPDYVKASTSGSSGRASRVA